MQETSMVEVLVAQEPFPPLTLRCGVWMHVQLSFPPSVKGLRECPLASAGSERAGQVVLVYKTKSGKPVITFSEVGRVLSFKVECSFQVSDTHRCEWLSRAPFVGGVWTRAWVPAPRLWIVLSCQLHCKAAGQVFRFL